MQISFWSNKHGQTGTTTNLIAIASSIALNYGLKVLITQNQFDNMSLERGLLHKNQFENQYNQFQDEGIDGINRLMKLNGLCEEHIMRCTTNLLKGRLDLLKGTRITNKEIYLNDFCNTFDWILSNINKYYDLVFIDSYCILDNADIIVVNLNQDTLLLDEFFEAYYPNLKEKVFLCIGNYDPASRYCIKNLKRYYNIQKPIGVVPYNRGFADAINEGQCVEFLLKHGKALKGDPYSYFIHEVNHTTIELLAHIGIDIKAKKLGD